AKHAIAYRTCACPALLGQRALGQTCHFHSSSFISKDFSADMTAELP
ncbi:7850_t:CDS:1, partial [Acaulospora colombiana]